MRKVIFIAIMIGVFLGFFGTLAANAAQVNVAGSTLVITGEITDMDSKQVIKVLSGGVDTVALVDSPGGSFIGAIELGRTVKTLGLQTVAVGYCYSACAYVWLASENRKALFGAELGIHAPYFGNGEPITDAVKELYFSYMAYIGVTDEQAIEILSTKPDNLLIIKE